MVTVKVHEAGRGYPLAVFDKAVEDTALQHQAGDFVGMHIGHGTRQTAVLDLPPLQTSLRGLHRFDRNAMFLQPDVQGIDIGEAGPKRNMGAATAAAAHPARSSRPVLSPTPTLGYRSPLRTGAVKFM